MTERESEVAWLYITRTPNVDALAKQEAMDAYRSLTARLSEAESENESLRGSLDEWRADFATVKAHASRLEGALERIRHFERTVDDEGDDITAGRMRYIARTALDSETRGCGSSENRFDEFLKANRTPPTDSETKER